MVKEHHIQGFEELQKLLETIKDNEKVVLYFAGTKNEEGENWCQDCEKAEPIVEEVLKEFEKKDFVFIHVSVGTREEWKDPKCPFRTDNRFKLTSVPTLMIYKEVERLNDTECQDKENIRALLEELPEKCV